jgi:hypothetical protein
VGGTYYVYGAALASAIGRHVANVEATAEVTAASVDNLKLLATGRADLGFTLAPALRDAYEGRRAFARVGRVPARALAVLNVHRVHLVTLEGLGIATVQDLRGRVVSTAQPGSGSEDVALRLLESVGIDPARDIRRQGSAGARRRRAARRQADAFFWISGSGVPALVELAIATGHRMRLLDLSATLAVVRAYGAGLFEASRIPSRFYPGVSTMCRRWATPNLLRPTPPERGARVRHHAHPVRRAGRAGRHRAGCRGPVAGAWCPRVAGAVPPGCHPLLPRARRVASLTAPEPEAALAKAWRGGPHRAVLAVGVALYALHWVVAIVEPQLYRVSFLLVALVLAFLATPRW